MRKKMLILILTAVAALAIGGCTPGERIAKLEQTLAGAQQVVTAGEGRIESLEQAAAALRAGLAEPGLPDEMRDRAVGALAVVEDKLADVRDVRDRAAAAIPVIQDAIEAARAGGQVDLAGELRIYGAAAAATGSQLPQPVGTYLALAGTILTALGGFAGMFVKNKEAKTKQNVVENLVESVDAALNSVDESAKSAAKAAMKYKQNFRTKAAVAQVKTGG